MDTDQMTALVEDTHTDDVLSDLIDSVTDEVIEWTAAYHATGARGAEPTEADITAIVANRYVKIELARLASETRHYCVEPHGDGHALYEGRTNGMHGYNLANMTEIDAVRLDEMLRRANAKL